jgi:hypothetical protein
MWQEECSGFQEADWAESRPAPAKWKGLRILVNPSGAVVFHVQWLSDENIQSWSQQTNRIDKKE